MKKSIKDSAEYLKNSSSEVRELVLQLTLEKLRKKLKLSNLAMIRLICESTEEVKEAQNETRK